MSKNTQPKNFEQALAELETIVTQLETGQLPLEASLATYKRGTELLQYCQQKLGDVEQQIRILDESGQLQPFTPSDD